MKKTPAEKSPQPSLAEKEVESSAANQTVPWFARPVVIGSVSLLFCAAIYWLRVNTAFGHPYVDDAFYLLLGKALADGQPYALTNAPVSGILPIYPPVYPWILSLIFRVAPSFPQNLWLFKLVPVLSTLGAGIACYYYFYRIRQTPRFIAYIIALFTVLSPSLTFFATSTLMSESFYMLLQICTLITAGLCAQCYQKQIYKAALGWALATGILVSIAFLTRSIGITLVAAILGAWLLRHWWKPMLVTSAVVAVLAGPWQLYARAHAPDEADKLRQQGYITQSYTTQFWQRAAGEMEMGFITPSEFPSRLGKNISLIAGEKFGLVMFPRLSPILGPAGFGFASVFLFLVGLIGWAATLRKEIGEAELYIAIYLSLVIAWPWEPTRFLLPLTPLLLFYVIRGGQVFYVWWQRDKAAKELPLRWTLASAFAVLLTLLNLIGNLEVIGTLDAQGRTKAGEAFTEIEEMMKWITQNINENEVCASLNPALVYLYTNRKTASAQDPLTNWEVWKQWKVRYLVLTFRYNVPTRDTAGKPVRIIYQSRRDPIMRVVDLGPPDERAPWPTEIN